MRIAVDTECTGLDLHHGARPYFVTVARDDKTVSYWHWRVDPLTRKVEVPPGDVGEIKEELDRADVIVGQNIRFDVHALATVGIDWASYWPRTVCTLMADHLLASSQQHDLTALAVRYGGLPIEKYEEALKTVTQLARSRARRYYRDWAIAKDGRADMPSVKTSSNTKAKGGEDDRVWKADAWLPTVMADEEGMEPDCLWYTALPAYANADSQSTLLVWAEEERRLTRRGLMPIYRERMKLLPIIQRMEARGLTGRYDTLDEIEQECREDSQRLGRLCVNIARSYSYDLKLPKGANNKSLLEFVFNVLKLPTVRLTDKNNPSFDKYAVAEYLVTLDHKSKPYLFVKSLEQKRKRDTDVGACGNYRRYALPFRKTTRVGEGRYAKIVEQAIQGYFLLHPNLNPTGTAHLRFSSSSPNGQNIGKQEDECEKCEGKGCGLCHSGRTRRSMREVFGPAPGREWWRFDYENIEQRIPAYVAPEPKMVELFERPDEPPYFGSFHLLNASIVYPELFWPLADQKGAFKKKYAAHEYQWIKNFGFGKNYGGGRATCDRAAHKVGAYDSVGDELRNLTRLNAEKIREANKNGYITTLPNKMWGGRGYPIWCQRASFGQISPTIPLNYFVSGTAMACMCNAMVRVDDYCQELTRADPRGYYICLQVHDELLLDFPKGGRDNVAKAMEVKRLMELSGDDHGVPLKVSVGYHPENWSDEEDIPGNGGDA